LIFANDQLALPLKGKRTVNKAGFQVESICRSSLERSTRNSV